MSQGFFDRNLSFETNGTSPGSEAIDQWVQSVQSVLSWTLVVTGVVGVMTNVLTILVFAKMGFSSTFHMSCTALAVSDVLCVVASAMTGAAVLGVFRRDVDAKTSAHMGTITGGLPQIVFSRITALITAWISVERCLSVAYPTKVRFIITRTVTKVALSIMFCLGFFFLLLASSSYRIGRRFDPKVNSTRWTLDVEENKKLKALTQFVRMFFGLILPVLSWVTVTICTVFLIVKLRQNSMWKKTAVPTATDTSSDAGDAKTTRPKQQVPVKERRVVKIVVVVTSIFLACSLPMSVHLLASFSLPEYIEWGALGQLFVINSLVCVWLSQVNSSINILVFAVSGQKFRSVLFGLFGFSKP
ncbi:hypothetical protein EGW08_010163 [Elysia chlorotica]|uniref:G-protein coupled receptors family 1 profile domain-containing protein n=1 Tax=Elysia chlorotica TaxID=188477 RepID=A0A3S0ZT22_ELYCH|nr:hypothetical protein EGW08_010163 [Elysia chlorotica]